MTESERQHHQLLKSIDRLEKEKLIIDTEIQAHKDMAISNVSKVYLVRILAIYAESAEFCQRFIDVIGADHIVEYLMHGDVHLQAAACVCMFQLARHDPSTLDALQNTPGGMIFVATRLTHPQTNGIITHRIAMDLLVEIAKRFELRRSMIDAGLIGPLLLLGDSYCQLLKRRGDQRGRVLRLKIEE
eukprot:COSAG05_NODE_15_length_36348_cov_78.369307_3_plen_187_part_00